MVSESTENTSASLKSERIQLKSERIQLKPEQILDRLKEVPGWILSDRGDELVKKYELPSNEAATAFLAFAMQVARDLGHEPVASIRGRNLEIRTKTEEIGGLSGADFDLARWIDCLQGRSLTTDQEIEV